MLLTKADLKRLSEIAIQAASEAGALIREKAGGMTTVQEKSAGSSRATQIVTEVDFQSQDLILKALRPTQEEYDFGLLTEELPDDGSRFEKDYFWCIDPLDGTLSFVNSKPGYAVSIALVSRSGESCLGVVYDPLEQILYHAYRDGGAFRNQKPWSLPQEKEQSTKKIDQGGAVMSACWALEQAPAYFCKQPKPSQGGGCLWDYAATTCLFQEMGAWVSDWAGNPLNLNRKDSLYMNDVGVIFASSPAIAENLLKSQS